MRPRSVSRRRFLKTTALAAGSALAAPYVRTAHAAGKVTLGLWDHWVPGANAVMKKICEDWGAQNHVEVQIDFITTIGDKLLLTAAAEAQAHTGHDIYTHYLWQIAVHRANLEPVDDVMAAMVRKYGPTSTITEFLAKHDGHWMGMPMTVGTQVKSCCSRLDLYKRHTGLDLQKIFPANDERNQELVDGWNWDLYLATAEKLHKAGFPVGLPMGQTTDTIDWVGALFRSFGAVMIDADDTIKVNSDETRAVLAYAKKLMAVNPSEVYAWDDAGNNRWLISGKGSGIMNPPSAWAVAKRDAPNVAAQCWTHDMPRGAHGRYVGHVPFFYGIWNFAEHKAAAKDLLLHLSEREQARQFVAASHGFDIPPFKPMLDFDTWAKEEPPPGTLYNYPIRGDHQPSVAGYPARPDIAAQIYNQVLEPVMIAKVTQGGESIDSVITWAEGELDGYLRS